MNYLNILSNFQKIWEIFVENILIIQISVIKTFLLFVHDGLEFFGEIGIFEKDFFEQFEMGFEDGEIG